jgi:hypothetical protein
VEKGGTTIVPEILDGIDQRLEALYQDVPRHRGPVQAGESPPCFFVDCPSIQAGRKRMGAREFLAKFQVAFLAGMESADSLTVAMNLLRELDRLETASGLVIPQGMIATVGKDQATVGFEVRYREAPVAEEAQTMQRETTKGAIR